MKWYNKELHQKFLGDLKFDIKRHSEMERYVLRYAKLVLKHARAVNLEEGKIGILDFNDILQMGFGACIEAWNVLNWDKINKAPNMDKTIVNYLSSNISGRIRRYILNEATGVRMNQHVITKTRKGLMADQLYGNWMFKFRNEEIMAEDDKVLRYIDYIAAPVDELSSWQAENLNDDLTTVMFKYLNDKEREILRLSYGIDCEKLTEVKIAEKLSMTRRGVQDAKKRAIDRLRNEECEIIFKDFL